MGPSTTDARYPRDEELKPTWQHRSHFDKDYSYRNNDGCVSIWATSRALKQTLKTIKLNARVIKTTANKIVFRGSLVGKPSDNNSLPASICANGIATRGSINNRRKSRAKIKHIHNRRILLCASKDGTFERENCFVTPLDGLNGRDASRLRAPWLHFTNCIPNKFGEFEGKKSQGRRTPLRVSGLKDSTSKGAGHYLSALALLLPSCFHRNQH